MCFNAFYAALYYISMSAVAGVRLSATSYKN